MGLFDKKGPEKPPSATKISFEVDKSRDTDKDLAASIWEDGSFIMLKDMLDGLNPGIDEGELNSLAHAEFARQLPTRFDAYANQELGAKPEKPDESEDDPDQEIEVLTEEAVDINNDLQQIAYSVELGAMEKEAEAEKAMFNEMQKLLSALDDKMLEINPSLSPEELKLKLAEIDASFTLVLNHYDQYLAGNKLFPNSIAKIKNKLDDMRDVLVQLTDAYNKRMQEEADGNEKAPPEDLKPAEKEPKAPLPLIKDEEFLAIFNKLKEENSGMSDEDLGKLVIHNFKADKTESAPPVDLPVVEAKIGAEATGLDQGDTPPPPLAEAAGIDLGNKPVTPSILGAAELGNTALGQEGFGDIPEDTELSRKAAMVTFQRVKKFADLNVDKQRKNEPDEDFQKRVDEKFKEQTRELWKELAVHGWIGKGGELNKHPDLDGKSALGLLALSGLKDIDLEFVPPGESVKNKINIDTGNRHGFVIEDKGETAFIDHHAPESGRDTSATKIAYETMLSLGLLEREDYLDELVAFVNNADNFNFDDYGDPKALFDDSHRNLIGLRNFIGFDKLLQFFKDGKKPTDNLTEKELKKYGFITKHKNRSLERDKAVEASIKEVKRLESAGLIIDSAKYGKIIIDIDKKIPAGPDATLAYGAGAYINWSPEKNSFFISTTDGKKLEIDLDQGMLIRGTMWIKPVNDQEPLEMSLEDILQELTDNSLTPDNMAAIENGVRSEREGRELEAADLVLAQEKVDHDHPEKSNQELRNEFFSSFEKKFTKDLKAIKGKNILLKFQLTDLGNPRGNTSSEMLTQFLSLLKKYGPRKITLGYANSDFEGDDIIDYFETQKFPHSEDTADGVLVEYRNLDTFPSDTVSIDDNDMKVADHTKVGIEQVFTISHPKVTSKFKYLGAASGLTDFLKFQDFQKFIKKGEGKSITSEQLMARFINGWQKRHEDIHILDATAVSRLHQSLGTSSNMGLIMAGKDVLKLDKQMVEILGTELEQIAYLNSLVERAGLDKVRVAPAGEEIVLATNFPEKLENTTTLVDIVADDAGLIEYIVTQTPKDAQAENSVVQELEAGVSDIFKEADSEKRFSLVANTVAKLRVIPRLESLNVLFDIIRNEDHPKTLSYLFETYMVFKHVLTDFGKKQLELPAGTFSRELDVMAKFYDTNTMRKMEAFLEEAKKEE